MVVASLAAARAVDGLQRHLAAYAPFDQWSFTSLNTASFPPPPSSRCRRRSSLKAD